MPHYRASLAAHNRALYYLARAIEFRLSADVIRDLTATVESHIGEDDDDAARRGVEWMRDQFREAGETPTF